MAELALRLPIIIASASDVDAERAVVEKVILKAQRRAAERRLLLEPVRWETAMRPGAGRPQEIFNEDHLRRAELVVFIFWSSLGSPATADGSEGGVLEEFRVAQSLVRSGSSDDLFIYFRDGTTGSDGERRVGVFKEEFKRRKIATTWDYASPSALEGIFAEHIDMWLERWIGVASACEETMWRIPPVLPPTIHLRENLLYLRLVEFDPFEYPAATRLLATLAVRQYQRNGPRAEAMNLSIDVEACPEVSHFIDDCDRGHRPGSAILRRGNRGEPSLPLWRNAAGALSFSSASWFYFFCAQGLYGCIVDDDASGVERQPYLNEVHQYLSALIDRHPAERDAIIARLVDWLSPTAGAGRTRPIVRNFAAYVLGMVQAVEAEDALAKAAREDAGLDVQTYAICALGKLRSRRHLGLLGKLRQGESDERKRLLIGQAICRITGVAHYEM